MTLAVTLQGGLCNKLFCLFSACELALAQGTQLLEPDFGWKRRVPFSAIYDLEHFNHEMQRYTGGRALIVRTAEAEPRRISAPQLWKLSQQRLAKERAAAALLPDCMSVAVLQALRLAPALEAVAQQHDTSAATALHVRVEPEWQRYARNKQRQLPTDERLLVPVDALINMYRAAAPLFQPTNTFFTSGSDLEKTQRCFAQADITARYVFEPHLEYEQNAAINFELCARAKHFVGLSRSTYSNLIALRRALTGNDSSYIYNLGTALARRVDKGLQVVGASAVQRTTALL